MTTLAINDITAGIDDAPKVEVLLTGLPPEVASVTVFRLSGGYEEPVSGIIEASVAGAGNWIDYEVPAQQATYKAQLFDSAGAGLGFSDPVTITLGFTGVWMHNPLAPTGAVRVELTAEALRNLSRPVPGGMVRPKGRRVGIMITGPRQGLEQADFSVYSEDLRTADRVQAFLGGPSVTAVPVICIRVGADHPELRVQSPLFLGVNDIPERDRTQRYGGTTTVQEIIGNEAARPAAGIFIPLLRRMDVNAFYASRAAFNAAYLTRLDANRDYSLAGYAG